jgi:thiol-disulfide isomerase/thioredoxin
MHIPSLRSRSAGVLAAAAAVAALAAVPSAGAAPLRTATTTGYTTATYLQHALGLPASDTDPAIQPVTYDRFQWLLQQPGNLAILIGDPAHDSGFAQRAQAVEAGAKATGVQQVAWFNPNLSGSAHVGASTEPNLDIRDPAGITALTAASQTKYDNAWKALVGQYLGNGLAITQNGLNTENATVTVVNDNTVVNDYGATATHSTKVGDTSGGALYDYSSGGAAPTDVQDSYFFIYNKDHQDGGHAAKVVSWTDLTGSSTAQADATTAIGVPGASNVTELSEFAFWKSEVNAKQATQASAPAAGSGVPVLGDADDADGWRVHQITYPELVDLLAGGADDANAVILFGGTWCPNTRAVLPTINKDAQRNGVQVYNFDTVLDGGLVGGATTSSNDPLQSRNTTTNGSGTAGSNPSWLYGDLVDRQLKNIKTEYDYTRSGTDPKVTYYPGGDTSGTLATTRKLQVPFVIGYQRDGAGNGVKRGWIIDKGDGSYTEYMSQWYLTNPQPNQLNITTIPPAAPIWSTINSELASFTWQSDPTTLYPNSAIDTDDAQYLVDADTATVTYTAGPPASVTVASGGGSPIGVSPAALSSALSALGSSAPVNLAAAKTALIAAKQASSPDATLIGNLTTVVGAWGVAQQRKTTVTNRWGTVTNPSTIAGGIAAVHALDVFFGGLPGGVLSHRTVTADTVTAGTAPKISIKIDNDYGRDPTGNVALTVKQGGTTATTDSAAVSGGTASFTLPALGAGTYDYTLSYAGDDQVAAFTENGQLTVSAAVAVTPPAATPPAATPAPVGTKPTTTTSAAARKKVSAVKGVVSKAPTSRSGGKYKVSITVPKGASAAGGKVTIKLKKGKVTKTLTGRLSKGVVTVTLPKLAKGTWKVAITFPGDTRYLTKTVAGASIKVIK